jgi:hypothetical protein
MERLHLGRANQTCLAGATYCQPRCDRGEGTPCAQPTILGANALQIYSKRCRPRFRDHGLEHGIAQQFRRAVRPDPADRDLCNRRPNCSPGEHGGGPGEHVLRGPPVHARVRRQRERSRSFAKCVFHKKWNPLCFEALLGRLRHGRDLGLVCAANWRRI